MANALAVVAGRQFWVWQKAYASANAFPADTVAYAGSFSGYSQLGYTNNGLGMNWNLQRGTIVVDQELDPIMRPAQSRALTLDTNLSEFTPANLQIATGQGDIVTNEAAAGSGTKGHHQIDINSTVVDAYQTVIFDIQQQNGEALRIAAWRGLPTGSPNPKFEPNNGAVMAYQISALPDSSTSPARIASVRLVVPGT